MLNMTRVGWRGEGRHLIDLLIKSSQKAVYGPGACNFDGGVVYCRSSIHAMTDKDYAKRDPRKLLRPSTTLPFVFHQQLAQSCNDLCGCRLCCLLSCDP